MSKKPRLTGEELEALARRVGAVLEGHRLEDCIAVCAICMSYALDDGYPPEQRPKAWAAVREAIERRSKLKPT